MALKVFNHPIFSGLVNPRKPTTLSWEELKDQIDAYSLSKFDEIRQDRALNNSNLYVCRVFCGAKRFYYEGSLFTEDYVKKREKNTHLLNPLTREKITAIDTFALSEDGINFIAICDESSLLQHVNCIPIILSRGDHTSEEKGRYLLILGECYRTGKFCEVNMNLAIQYLRMAAEFGNQDAQHNLSIILGNLSFVREAIYWAIEPWKDTAIDEIPVHGLINLGNCFEKQNYRTEAFTFFHKAACLGNPYAIAKIICYYESNKTPENLNKIAFWKQLVPLEWRNQPAYDYLRHTCTEENLFITQFFQIPDSLKSESFLEHLPNPEDYPVDSSLISRIKSSAQGFLGYFGF